MATTRGGEDEPQPTRAARAEGIVRSIVAGHEQGAIRRIALYVGMFACMGLAFYAPVFVIPALVCAVLLLATDGAL